MNLRELFDLPEHLGTEDYVLKLSQAIQDSAATVRNYVVTEQLARCFDEALTLVRDALGADSGFTESKAAYLHGSFGAGKSHFMAMLYLLLHEDTNARAVPELSAVVSKHSNWTRDRKFLLVTYHMSDAKTLEERLFTGYVDRVRELHPDTPPPAVYRSDALLVDAHRLREKMGDKEFFQTLSAGVTDTGWGSLSGWDAASFDYAAAAPYRDAEHSRLVGDLVRNVFTSARQTAEFVDIDDGLSLISKHAKALGYDAVILFLDEVMLWLASRSTDEAAKEGPKLAKLVEGGKADRPAPLISFLARQRALNELLGKADIGEQQAKVEEVLEWWNQRFRTVTLEDRNLPEVVQKRLLRPRSDTARQLIADEYAKALRMQNNVLETLMTRDGDREQFKKLYPFTPAFMEVLVGAASVLQRQRTGLRLLAQILDQDARRMQLGEIFPVGDLFRIMEQGSDPFLENMRKQFEYARALWKRFKAQIEHDAQASFEDFDKLPADKQRQLRAQERIAGTLILARLVPNLESFRELNGTRLAALNYGSVKTPIPGAEGQQVLAMCRRWANLGLVQLADPGSATTTISVELTSVDVNAIIESAARAHESYGNIALKAGQLLFEEFSVKVDDDFTGHYNFVWRATDRSCEISSFNIHEGSLDKLKPSTANGDWLLVVDSPVYKPGHGPADHLRQLRDFEKKHPEGAHTIVWVPSALSEQAVKDLGRLTVIEYLLNPQFDKLKEHSASLNAIGREQARSILAAMQRELTVSVKTSLAHAYGVGTILPASLDPNLQLSAADQFQSLEDGFQPRRPSSGKLNEALKDLLSQALDFQFPGHPDFKSDEITVKPKIVSRAYDYLMEALRDSQGRKLLIDKKERVQLRGLLEPLNLAQVTDQYLFPNDYWYSHFERAHHDAGGGVITVGKLRDYLDKPKPMGLETNLQDLIILFYAAWTNRSFRTQWGPAEAKLGALKNDWQLIEEQLPSRESWQIAVRRASSLFGSADAALNLNAAVLAKFFADVQLKAKEKVSAAQQLVPLLTDPTWDRYKSAVASRDLVQRLANTRNGLEIVDALESAPAEIKEDVLARSLAHADKVVAELSHPGWKVALDNLRSLTLEPYAQAARSIVADVDEAFRVNELTKELVPVLHKAMEDGRRILSEANRAAAPPPPLPMSGPIRPPIVPPSAQGAKLKKVVAQGSRTTAPKDLDAVFQEIRAKVPSKGESEILLSWEIVSEE